MALNLNKLESHSPEDALFQVWLKLAQWLWRRRWKCEKFTDRQADGRTTGDQKSSSFSSVELKTTCITTRRCKHKIHTCIVTHTLQYTHKKIPHVIHTHYCKHKIHICIHTHHRKHNKKKQFKFLSKTEIVWHFGWDKSYILLLSRAKFISLIQCPSSFSSSFFSFWMIFTFSCSSRFSLCNYKIKIQISELTYSYQTWN